MQPIVNGLEAEFGERLVFEHIDANTDAGAAAMRAYALRGHPSYAIVAADGSQIWTFSGQIAEELLRQRVVEYAE